MANEFKFVVTVRAKAGLERAKAAAIVRRLINIGLDDLAEAPPDYDDPDLPHADKITSVKVTDPRRGLPA